METVFSDLQNHWECCRTRFGKGVRTGDAERPSQHSDSEKAGVVLPLSTWCPTRCSALHRHYQHLIEGAAMHRSHCCSHQLLCKWIAAPCSLQTLLFNSESRMCVSYWLRGRLHVCTLYIKNGWLRDDVAFLASILKDRLYIRQRISLDIGRELRD